MTDKELLELAAKAAGMPYKWHCHGMLMRYEGDQWNGGPLYWDPRQDDGQALRLAVKLGFLVDTNGMYARVCFHYEEPLAYEPMNDDRAAATRLAITRAAAEIGKAKP